MIRGNIYWKTFAIKLEKNNFDCDLLPFLFFDVRFCCHSMMFVNTVNFSTILNVSLFGYLNLFRRMRI